MSLLVSLHQKIKISNEDLHKLFREHPKFE